MREIVIDAQKCVGCGDCSLVCPVKVYTLWKELSEDRRREIIRWSLEKRRVRFSQTQSDQDARKAKQLAARIFAHIDVASCLACGQCSEICFKEAITVSDS
ncbi:MAG: 4Fe-4S binding protein [Desulfobacterales bacterium]|nr:4Fe-4S binding protein [Desulfobacterales bacterium]